MTGVSEKSGVEQCGRREHAFQPSERDTERLEGWGAGGGERMREKRAVREAFARSLDERVISLAALRHSGTTTTEASGYLRHSPNLARIRRICGVTLSPVSSRARGRQKESSLLVIANVNARLRESGLNREYIGIGGWRVGASMRLAGGGLITAGEKIRMGTPIRHRLDRCESSLQGDVKYSDVLDSSILLGKYFLQEKKYQRYNLLYQKIPTL